MASVEIGRRSAAGSTASCVELKLWAARYQARIAEASGSSNDDTVDCSVATS
jgi:hypothetical protein